MAAGCVRDLRAKRSREHALPRDAGAQDVLGPAKEPRGDRATVSGRGLDHSLRDLPPDRLGGGIVDRGSLLGRGLVVARRAPGARATVGVVTGDGVTGSLGRGASTAARRAGGASPLTVP